MHSVSAKAGRIPEEHLSAFCFGLSRNRRIALTPPPVDGFGITLIDPLQRLLRR